MEDEDDLVLIKRHLQTEFPTAIEKHLRNLRASSQAERGIGRSQSQYKQCKPIYLDKLRTVHLQEHLDSYRIDSSRSAQDLLSRTEHELHNASKQLQSIKKELNETREAFDEAVAMLQDSLQNYNKVRKIQQLLLQIEEKKSVDDREAALLKSLESPGNELSLGTLATEIRGINQQVQSYKNLYEQFSAAVQKYAEKKRELETEMMTLTSLNSQSQQQQQTNQIRHTNANILERYYAVKIISASGNLMELDIAPPGKPDTFAMIASLKILISFSKRSSEGTEHFTKTLPNVHLALHQWDCQYKIGNVEFIPHLERELFTTATERNYLQSLLKCTLKFWRQHQQLYSEIEQLRTRYALDWLQKERIIKVLLYSAAQGDVTCCLKVADVYPNSDTCPVTIDDVSKTGVNFKFSDECHTVTDCVLHIVNAFMAL